MKRLAIILAAWLGLAGSLSAQTFPGDWAGYIEATADAPAGSLTDFVYIIQIDSSNTAFWDNVRSDGGDIRVTIDGTQVPVDPMTDIAVWNYAGESAVIACKRSGAASTAPVIRVYAGCPSATLPATNSTYGQDNAYASHWRAFYPLGGGNDRTSYNNDLTMVGSPTVGGASGPISGSLATDYSGSGQYGYTTVSVPAAAPMTLIAHANTDDASGIRTLITVANVLAANNFWALQDRGTANGVTSAMSCQDSGSYRGAFSSSTYSSGTWYHRTGRATSATSRDCAIDGTFGTANTISATPSGVTDLTIGAFRTTTTTQAYNGRIAFASAHSAALTDDWVAYEAAMLADPDQSDFYNGWTANFSGGGSPKISPALLNSVIQ